MDVKHQQQEKGLKFCLFLRKEIKVAARIIEELDFLNTNYKIYTKITYK
jgi:hypothetical protein